MLKVVVEPETPQKKYTGLVWLEIENLRNHDLIYELYEYYLILVETSNIQENTSIIVYCLF